ncbi:Uncharacterised protein [Mycobacteroides abscessus subsp. abscessus]|nr:Uncharacterised protein [Mycobacteroides abscessus subsp. abscessus]
MVCQSLPVTQMRFPQALVDRNPDVAAVGQRRRGVIGTLQIRGNDRQRQPLGQHLGGGHGLSPAQIRQPRVELSLHAAVGVEGCLSVSQQHQPPDHAPSSASAGASVEYSAGSASSSTGMVGQSRQRRSSA